ncbi:MAG: hypothetical protein KUG56_03565, partial [Kordiimonadaceae bacterium]|nr:hypothetical protein [Kordiimonadaceae bacterium]
MSSFAVETNLKKSAATFHKIAFVMANYSRGKATQEDLRKAEGKVEDTWNDLVKYMGVSHPLAKRLSLIRARTLTAAGRDKKIVSAWKDALRRLPKKLPRSRRINLYTEAANAAAVAGDFRAAESFYGVARSLAVMRSRNKEKAQLYMRLHELRSTGVGMEWRPLRDALSDLRKASEHFALWSIPRVDALLGEAEIRVAYQPNMKEKRTDLGELKAQLILAQKGMEEGMPEKQLKRMRS